MSRSLMLGASTITLAMGLTATAPIQAQVVPLPDASIEGPISAVTINATTKLRAPCPGTGNALGEMTVMGVKVKVLTGASIHSDTNPVLTLASLRQAPTLPGRTKNGFIGGTAIVTGDSVSGVLCANDVFVEAAENVVVGESTGTTIDVDLISRSTINGVIVVPLTDPRTPAGPPINSFGFEIDPFSIPLGSAFSVAGYFAGGRIYYHTLEADAGNLLDTTSPQVSILRAQCRARNDGRSRDELEVRGGAVNPAEGPVTIEYLAPDGTWIAVAPSVAPVVDPLVSPPQGLYRYTSSSLNFGAICPAQVRAVLAGGLATTDGFSPDSR